MDAVRCYIDKAQDRWDEHLTQIAGTLRSAVNRHSGFTANMLMLGREVNTPANVMYRSPLQERPVNLDTYVADLEKRIQCAHETDPRRLHTSEERIKSDFDLKAATCPFEEGDLVYLLDTATVKGKCRKLSPSWKGSGIILKKLLPYLYRVKTKTAVMLANHDRLKKCNGRDIPLWLAGIGRKL